MLMTQKQSLSLMIGETQATHLRKFRNSRKRVRLVKFKKMLLVTSMMNICRSALTREIKNQWFRSLWVGGIFVKGRTPKIQQHQHSTGNLNHVKRRKRIKLMRGKSLLRMVTIISPRISEEFLPTYQKRKPSNRSLSLLFFIES